MVGPQTYETDRALERALREVVLVIRSAAQLAHRNSNRLTPALRCVKLQPWQH